MTLPPGIAGACSRDLIDCIAPSSGIAARTVLANACGGELMNIKAPKRSSIEKGGLALAPP
jgi:hypothetical protein